MLKKLHAALRVHVQSVGDMSSVAGTGNRDAFILLEARARQSLKAVRAAWDAHQKHINEHHCQQAPHTTRGRKF